MHHLKPGESLLSTGFLQLFHTIGAMRKLPMTLLFLLAFLIYNDAIQAVITLSGQFGADYLKIPMGTLTMAILMVQFVAFAGALLFNQVAKWLTAKNAVLLALVIWTLLMVAMFMVKTTLGFYLAAAVVLAGIQGLAAFL